VCWCVLVFVGVSTCVAVCSSRFLYVLQCVGVFWCVYVLLCVGVLVCVCIVLVCVGVCWCVLVLVCVCVCDGVCVGVFISICVFINFFIVAARSITLRNTTC